MFFGIMAVGGLILCGVLCGLDYDVQVLPPVPGGKGPDPDAIQEFEKYLPFEEKADSI